MENKLFVGREAQIAKLKNLIKHAAQNQGSMTFLAGEPGIGKSELIEATIQQTASTPELEDAHYAYAYCFEDTGNQNAYQPLLDLLVQLTKAQRKRGEFAKFILSLVKETGPDWLQMIPGIGPAISAGIKTAVLSGNWLLNTPEDQLTNSAALATQYADTIIKISSHHHPLVLIIEDIHWIDEASCYLLMRLARQIHNQSLVILLTYRPSYLDEKHPLRDLIGTANSLVTTHSIPLKGLGEDQIQKYIENRFGASSQPQLSSWLLHLCNGNPLFVSQYLTLLEQNHILKQENNKLIFYGTIDYANGEWMLSENIPTPENVEAIIEQRIQRLVKQDQELLQRAAVQGENFLSSVLSQLLNTEELDLLPRLRVIAEQYQMIRYGLDLEEWSGQEAELYAFTHSLMHRAFYNKLSPRERVLYHRKIANILETAIQTTTYPANKLILEAAHHFNLGGIHDLAAKYYYTAAKNSFNKGAFGETIELCKLALKNMKAGNNRQSEARLHAETLQLLLVASEMRWYGKIDANDEFSLISLAEEATEAAKISRDKTLLAQAYFLKGRILIATKSLGEAVAVTNNALTLACAAGDKASEFIILSYLGYITKAADFDKGMELSYQAYDLYQNHLNTEQDKNRIELTRNYLRLKGFIGIGEFDRGNYGEAVTWLQQSMQGLEQLNMLDDLLRILNFLGQVYIAIGSYEKAEDLLKKSINLIEDNEEPNPWRGYNKALLGKLYLEWNRVEDAAEPIHQGWQETQSAWNVDLVRLVRMYYINLLMHPDYAFRDLEEATEQLAIELDETLTSGFYDMAIVALSYQALLALELGNAKSALERSSQAIQYIEEMGGNFPSFRAEEVFYNHFQILIHAGKHEEIAAAYLQRAYDLLRKKASSLPDESQRRSFWERIPLNKSILSAFEKI